MSSLTATLHSETLCEAYRKLLENAKPKKVARVAISRKLLIHLNPIISGILSQENSMNPLSRREDSCWVSAA